MGVTNQRETVVVWDKATGRPIHPGHRLAGPPHRRRSASGLRGGGHEAVVTDATGLLLDPYFSATKIAWILDKVRRRPGAGRGGELLAGTIDTWLIWRLTGGTGAHATDATNASRTLLFDIQAQAWSDEMLRPVRRAAGPCCPQSATAPADYGQVTPDILGRPLADPRRGRRPAGGADGAGLHPARRDEGHLRHRRFHAAQHRRGAAPRLGGAPADHRGGAGGRRGTTYALEGSIFVAGAAIKWLNEGPGRRRRSARRPRPWPRRRAASTAVVVVPAFTGLGAPWWDAEARGAVFGLTRDAGLAEIAAGRLRRLRLRRPAT